MSSVPFFKDFNKRVRGYFREEKLKDEAYDIQQRIQFKASCCDSCELTAKLNNTTNKTKLKLKLKKDFGEIEACEVLGENKLRVEVKIPSIYKCIDWKSKHTSNTLEVDLKYNPESYFNVSLNGTYEKKSTRDEDGSGCDRLCTATASFACGDDSLHLNVGGQITVCDRPGNDSGLIQDYKLGFLYEPSADASYSVIYSPDKISNGLDFNFSCFKQVSENLSVVGKALGKVDFQKSGINPVLSVGSGYCFGDHNYWQAFVSSNKEYGISYCTKLGDNVEFSVGVANYLDGNENGRNLVSRFGYNLQFC